jgi:hypothetical protein
LRGCNQSSKGSFWVRVCEKFHKALATRGRP